MNTVKRMMVMVVLVAAAVAAWGNPVTEAVRRRVLAAEDFPPMPPGFELLSAPSWGMNTSSLELPDPGDGGSGGSGDNAGALIDAWPHWTNWTLPYCVMAINWASLDLNGSPICYTQGLEGFDGVGSVSPWTESTLFTNAPGEVYTVDLSPPVYTTINASMLYPLMLRPKAPANRNMIRIKFYGQYEDGYEFFIPYTVPLPSGTERISMGFCKLRCCMDASYENGQIVNHNPHVEITDVAFACDTTLPDINDMLCQATGPSVGLSALGGGMGGDTNTPAVTVTFYDFPTNSTVHVVQSPEVAGTNWTEVAQIVANDIGCGSIDVASTNAMMFFKAYVEP